MSGKKLTLEIKNDPDFIELKRQKSAISLILTVIELVLYFGFIGLIAYNKPFLCTQISGAINIGIPLAVGTIFLSWILTGIYIWWANAKYDVLVKKVKDKVGGQ
ncbi:MAG: DUF485 domain-containing protein [Nitrospirae bacterium]|nr:DUF485 domain-containing protein [Nitrospirota bacterium]